MPISSCLPLNSALVLALIVGQITLIESLVTD